MNEVHPVLLSMRALRLAARMSLVDAGYKLGMSPIALGSYERGDRNPPLFKAEHIVRGYGYTLAAVPLQGDTLTANDAIRLASSMAAELRRIADHIEMRAAQPHQVTKA